MKNIIAYMSGKFTREKRKRIKMIIAVAAASISLLIFAAIILFWAGVIVAANFDFASVIYLFAGIVLVPACLYFLIRQRQKFMFFCLVCKNRKMPKHTPKTMIYSLVKYSAVILIVITASYGILVIPMLPVYVIVAHCMFNYAKVWKYHGYSVLLLSAATIVMFAASIMLSPFIRTGISMLNI